MGNFIKTALVFMGGMTAGGYCVANAVLKSKTVSTALREGIKKKIVEATYDSKSNGQKISYLPMYDTPHKREMPNRCLECCDDLTFETRKDAEKTLAAMAEIIEKYGHVSLADLYEIAGSTGVPYAARKYGWLSVDDGKVIRGRWGYFIKLPKAIEIR